MNDNQLFRWWGAVEKKKAKKRGRLSGILGNQNALDILSRVIHLLYKTKQPKASRRLYIFIHLYLNSNRLACVLKQSWIVNFVLKKSATTLHGRLFRCNINNALKLLWLLVFIFYVMRTTKISLGGTCTRRHKKKRVHYWTDVLLTFNMLRL